MFWPEIIVAIGGPKTNQHVKAKNKSLNKTRMVLKRRLSEFNFFPIKFITLIQGYEKCSGILIFFLSFAFDK